MLKQILWDYRFIIVVILGVSLYCLFEWQRAKTIAYGIMVQAKILAKDAVLKSGQQQEEWVCERAYQFLPKTLTIFISEDNMRKLVHYLYSKAKDYLDDGQLNDSIQ